MSYSMETSVDSCYEGTTCLINKLNIRDEQLLQETESAITLAKISYLDMNPMPGAYDFAHYRAIHRFLFSDLYDWAGELRTVDFSKKGTHFMAAERIEESANACFARVAALDFAAMESDERIEEIADFYSTLNMIHPFREGNGRTQRVYFTQWLRHMGYEVEFSSIDPDIFMFATIHAAQGVLDDLKDIFAELLFPQQEMGMQQTFL